MELNWGYLPSLTSPVYKATLFLFHPPYWPYRKVFLCLRRMAGPPSRVIAMDIPTNPSKTVHLKRQTRRGIEPHPNIKVRTVQTYNTGDNITTGQAWPSTRAKGKPNGRQSSDSSNAKALVRPRKGQDIQQKHTREKSMVVYPVHFCDW